MTRTATRRELMARATATALTVPVAVRLLATTSEAAPADMRAALARLTNNAEVRTGRVKIDVPPLSENGNTVPITVTVQSPMTAADHVKAIHVLSEKNPQPLVISAWMGPRAGEATLQTRMRLADTQVVIAVAQMSDGSFWSESASVIVTLGACLEDPI